MSFDYATYPETIAIVKELQWSISGLLNSKEFHQMHKQVRDLHLISNRINQQFEEYKSQIHLSESRIMNEIKLLRVDIEKSRLLKR